MTIKAIYKLEDDSNEYETEQQAQVAECLQGEGVFFTRDEKLFVAKAITAKYFLCPILKTETAIVTEKDYKEAMLGNVIGQAE